MFVKVRPLSLNLSGVEHHVVQGTIVLLQCLVLGARPAANITWYNGTQPMPGYSSDRTAQVLAYSYTSCESTYTSYSSRVMVNSLKPQNVFN